jgi:hypothetical protein
MAHPTQSKEEIVRRYLDDNDLLGYESAMNMLTKQHGLSESEADDLLHPPKVKHEHT